MERFYHGNCWGELNMSKDAKDIIGDDADIYKEEMDKVMSAFGLNPETFKAATEMLNMQMEQMNKILFPQARMLVSQLTNEQRVELFSSYDENGKPLVSTKQ